jgi:choice-of-anchor A domain-containing protein
MSLFFDEIDDCVSNELTMLDFNLFREILFSFVGCTSLPGAWVLATYNLVTLGDLSTSSDVDNNTIICGSLVSGSSANFGIHITSSTSTAAIYSLEVNGQIASGSPINVDAGSFGVGTNPSHTITSSGNVGYTVDGRTVNMNGGNQGATVNVDTNLATKCSSITSAVQTLSTYLAALSNTTGNNVSAPTTQPGPLNLYVNAVDSNGLSVFNLNGNTVLSNPLVQQIEIIVGSSVSSTLQLVVINLSGTSISYSYGNFVGTWLTSVSTGRAQTIWNLPQATLLYIGSDWMGALLAPYAAVTTAIDIDGAAAVLSLTATAELHNPPLTLPACTSTTTTTSNTSFSIILV